MVKSKSIALALAFGLAAGAAGAQDLRIGLQDDPDILDPDQSRTFVGRIVYASMCDKLVDIHAYVLVHSTDMRLEVVFSRPYLLPL